MTLLQVIFAVIGMLLAFFGVVLPLFSAVDQMKRKLEWDKAMVFFELGKIWTEETVKHRMVIEKRYGSYMRDLPTITVSDPEALVNASEGDDLHALKVAVVSLMNHFELIADLYTYGMVDRQLVDASIKTPMCKYYHKIKPLADCFDKVAGYPSWKPLDDLIGKWEEEEKKKAVVPEKSWFVSTTFSRLWRRG